MPPSVSPCRETSPVRITAEVWCCRVTGFHAGPWEQAVDPGLIGLPVAVGVACETGLVLLEGSEHRLGARGIGHVEGDLRLAGEQVVIEPRCLQECLADSTVAFVAALVTRSCD